MVARLVQVIEDRLRLARSAVVAPRRRGGDDPIEPSCEISRIRWVSRPAGRYLEIDGARGGIGIEVEHLRVGTGVPRPQQQPAGSADRQISLRVEFPPIAGK